MSDFVFKLPDVGEGVAEAEIVEWKVAVGDVIGEDQPVVDVMTDKATVELPSPVAGTVARLGAEVGEVVPVGSPLVWIDVDGAGPSTDTREAGEEAEAREETGAEAPAGAAEADAAQAVKEIDERVSRDGPDAPPATDAPVGRRTAPRPERAGPQPLAAPAVRQRARALGIDLATVTGTGPDGRVVHGDLDGLLSQRGGVSPAATAPRLPARAPDEVESVKIAGLRRNIAARMEEAHRIPHFTYVEEIDVTEVERVRTQLNDAHPNDPKLTVLPFLARAVVLALDDFPQMNARFRSDDGVVDRHRAVHLGIATQTEKGLMVPVVEHVEALDIWECAAEIARLAGAARDGSITLAELSGSTITITSLGALGGVASTPVINAPEVAIIGVNKIVDRPVLTGGGWVPRQVMNLSSSFDHRVVDGWDAAQFIQRVRQLLETPALLFVGD
jgi:2-oxoisovalerate dehydrogenase E2 component (dihydrolipoyl transacylase)